MEKTAGNVFPRILTKKLSNIFRAKGIWLEDDSGHRYMDASGGTFTHHPVTAAAGLAVLRILEREDLIAQVESRGKTLGAMLQKTLGHHPHVAGVRGAGFMWGVELVKDRGTLEPFDRSDHIVERVWDAALEEILGK